MQCSLVIPCYNEALNLPKLIERCRALTQDGRVEVILVDNGSSDDTPAVLQQLLADAPGCRSLRVAVNQGYGFGILSGLAVARGDYIGWTHADLQTDPQDILRVLPLIEQAKQAVFIKGRRQGRPLADVFFTVGMSVFESLLLRTPLWDINAQPTIFPRSFFETWMQAPHDFSLDLYAYYLARRMGLRVQRIRVNFGARAHGVSHWNVNWRAKWKFIRRTVAFSFGLQAQLKALRSPNARELASSTVHRHGQD